MRRHLIAGSGVGGLVAAVGSTGWVSVIGIIVIAHLLTGMICWIVNDSGRTNRCAHLILSCRGGQQPQKRQSSDGGRPREADQASH
jgi:hypothetical protein